MYDLKFYSEYFFRARPELVELDHVKGLADNKDKQQLINESATAAKGWPLGQVQSTERLVSPEHRVGAQIKKTKD